MINNKKVALISGISGQDGSYLTELLLGKGYTVHGIIRRSSSFNTFRIDHLYKDKTILNKCLFLHYGDLTDSSNLNRLVEKIQPSEIYNLGAQSHVQYSLYNPVETYQTNTIGTMNVLEAARINDVKRIVHAGSAEVYGKPETVPIEENHPSPCLIISGA